MPATLPRRAPAFPPARLFALTALGALLAVLTACGGGGSDSGAKDSSGGGTTTATTSSATAQAMTLSGVAALGAPLADAQVQVMDATGALVGSATTRSADGGYTLTTKSATAPLLVQVAGVHPSGKPVLLHSALAAGAATAVVNVTPLTEAVLAVALGTEPRLAWAEAKPATLKGLATLSAASDFIKSLVKTPLADAKVSDLTKLDLFSDSAFAANKAGVDLALELLASGYATDSAGKALLTLGNKLANTPTEVTVDLATAAAELAKSSSGTPAKAITSTLLTVTSPTTLVPYVALLDDVAAALNSLIAANAGKTASAAATSIAAATALANYTLHDGQKIAGLSERLGAWAAKRMQLGRLTVLGCADETLPKAGCSHWNVAGRATDSTGSNIETLVDAVRYDAKATTKLALSGNGFAASLVVRSAAVLSLTSEGQAGSNSATPATGVQLLVGNAAASATVLTPGGYVMPMVGCSRPLLCIATTTGDTAVTATGLASDDTVLRGVSAWVGAADLVQAARYKATLVATDNSTAVRSAYLLGAFPSAPASSRFATLDNVAVARPVPAATLIGGGTLSWAAWAARQPDMRVTGLRHVLVDSAGAITITDTSVPAWPASASTSVTLDASTVTDAVSATLWLIAVDSSGRAHLTRYDVL